MTSHLWLSVSLSFICFYGAGGFLYCWVSECAFNYTDLEDIQYIRSYVFNKQELIRWDSRVGKHVGYTEYGVYAAEYWNNLPGLMAGMRAEPERYCKPTVANEYSHALVKTVEPYVMVTSMTPPGGRRTAMLQCSAYSFYPKQILLTWLRDGEETTSQVSDTHVLPDGDWYYQYHSYLEYTPRSGEQITCMVEHPGLMEPIMVDWDDSMPDGVKNKLALGAAGLVLGLVFFLSGSIYFLWRKRGGRIAVPTTN